MYHVQCNKYQGLEGKGNIKHQNKASHWTDGTAESNRVLLTAIFGDEYSGTEVAIFAILLPWFVLSGGLLVR
jgi:hypothetical protein